MPAEKATVIVLRVIEFSETSLVVWLFSREYGKLRVLAKGARRLKNPFESALDLLAVCRIVFLRKSSEALDLLTEAKLQRRFRPAGRNLASLYAGYYVAELLNELTDEYDPHADLFDLADATLGALAGGEPVAREVLRFELGLLRSLGLLPSLDACAACGRAVTGTSDRTAFGLLDGGVLCRQCRGGKKQVASVTRGVLRIMAQLADPGSANWRRMEIDSRSGGELRGLLNHYLCNLLGKKPRMHRYLSFLSG